MSRRRRYSAAGRRQAAELEAWASSVGFAWPELELEAQDRGHVVLEGGHRVPCVECAGQLPEPQLPRPLSLAPIGPTPDQADTLEGPSERDSARAVVDQG